MKSIEDKVIERFVLNYGQPDRKEEQILRESAQWTVQEYVSSEYFKSWSRNIGFMMNTQNMNNPVWWVKHFSATLGLAAWAVIIYAIGEYLGSVAQ